MTAIILYKPSPTHRATVNDGRDPDPDLDLKEMGVAGREDTHRALALTPVDVLFSQWFLHRDLVRLVFREKLAFSRDGGAVGVEGFIFWKGGGHAWGFKPTKSAGAVIIIIYLFLFQYDVVILPFLRRGKPPTTVLYVYFLCVQLTKHKQDS